MTKEELLCGKYWKIRNMLNLYAISECEREELAQEVFITAYRKLDELRDLNKIDGWLFAIARNMCRRYMRQESRRLEKQVAGEDAVKKLEHLARETEHGDVLTILERAEISRQIAEAMKALKTNENSVIYLHHIDGYSLKEVSDMLEVNYNTVKTMHKRALGKLRKTLEKTWEY